MDGPNNGYSLGDRPAPDAVRLHLNEYRFSHPTAVKAALHALKSVSCDDDRFLREYQVGPYPLLVGALARYVNVPSELNILVTAGSDDALRAVVGACGHRTVLTGVPTYAYLEHIVRARGLDLVTFPMGIDTPPDAVERALRYYGELMGAGCLVYLCSPNNPTGHIWSGPAVVRLAEDFPNSTFLIDEAYVEFASWSLGSGDATGSPPGDDAASLNDRSVVDVAMRYSNVVVSRTLSKAFGLASLRVGYLVGLELGRYRAVVSPKEHSPLTPVAWVALGELAHYRKCAAMVRGLRTRMVSTLRALGWYVVDTPANFCLLYAGDTRSFVSRLAANRVLVRDRGELPGLSGFVRITVGNPSDQVMLINALIGLTPPAGPVPQTLYTPKDRITELKRLTREVLRVLGEVRVQAWAQSGTMLGVFRHKGIIPTDDDCDLAYLRGAVDPLATLADAFRARGLTLQRNRTDAYWQVGTNAPGERISEAHVDVFSYSYQPQPAPGLYVLDDERYRDEDPDSPEAHCNTKYAPDELFPLYEGTFYDLKIMMPAQSEKVLRRALGDDFMTVVRARTAAGVVVYPLTDSSPA